MNPLIMGIWEDLGYTNSLMVIMDKFLKKLVKRYRLNRTRSHPIMFENAYNFLNRSYFKNE